MSTNSSIHLWFMYSLLGMLISAPFLAKLFTKMTDWELKLLFGITLSWSIISIYLTQDLNIGFSYSGWFITGWMFSFFNGYFCKRIVTKQNKKKFYFAGIVGLIISIWGQSYIPEHYKNATDNAAAFVLFSIAAYIFIENEIVIKNIYLKSIILYLGKYSFLIYMLHWNVLWTITPKIVKIETATGYFFVGTLVTLLISFLMAILLNLLIISPIQKMLRKFMKLV